MTKLPRGPKIPCCVLKDASMCSRGLHRCPVSFGSHEDLFPIFHRRGRFGQRYREDALAEVRGHLVRVHLPGQGDRTAEGSVGALGIMVVPAFILLLLV